MDGLMIDSESVYWAAGRKVAALYGKTVADATLGRMMGRKPIESLQVFAAEVGLDASPEELLTLRDDLAFESLSKRVPMMPGLPEVLAGLHGRYILAVATSATRKFVDAIMVNLGIAHRFKVIQTSDDVTRGKPDPEIYLKAMARAGVAPHQCVVLEDSSNGSLAGKRSGAYTIAVPSLYTQDQDFSFVDYIAKDLIDAARRIADISATSAGVVE